METAVTIICSVLASSGMWAFLTALMNKRSASSRMLLGLGHDRILALCDKYIQRGYITMDEYDNLINYLYLPYKALGGNGTAERAIDLIKQLPVHS